jgi:3-oxoadipate enol-lactonase
LTQIHDTVAATPPQGYIGCAAAIQNFRWTHRLPEICAPTLVLCGSDDPGASPEENRMISETVQRGEFIAIEGARHLPNVEDPGRFNRIVIDWCDRHRS